MSCLSLLSLLPAFRFLFFFFNDTATTEIYTLSLHDALPIFFFATNALKKARGVDGAPAPVAVQRLGIVGSGFMGSGIAGTAVAQATVDVRMKDSDLTRVAGGLRAAQAILDDRLKRRRITKYEHV